MRKAVRELLEANGWSKLGGHSGEPSSPGTEEPAQQERTPEMADGINLSKEQFEALLEAIANPRMNPLEQRKLDEELKRDKRRSLLAVELGKAEEMKRYNQQVGCSHSRDARTGDAVARGTGEWTTGGQVHGDDTITLICLRCGTRWTWKASPQEREYSHNHGLLGFPPPPVEKCINKADFARPQIPDQNKLDAIAG